MRLATAIVELFFGVVIFIYSLLGLADRSGVDHFAALLGVFAGIALAWRGIVLISREGKRSDHVRGFEVGKVGAAHEPQQTVGDAHPTAEEADSARRDVDGPQR